MEVAASVAGLISLGIQVTGGLFAYIDAFTDRDGDLHATSKRISLLHSQLQTIESISQFSEAKHQYAAGSVRACIIECEIQLKPLEDFLLEEGGGQLVCSKTSDSNGSKLKEAVARIKKKGTYPFKRSKVEALKRRLDDATNALGTALTTLNLYEVP